MPPAKRRARIIVIQQRYRYTAPTSGVHALIRTHEDAGKLVPHFQFEDAKRRDPPLPMPRDLW